MQPLRNTTTGYLRTPLAIAVFLLASQPARASGVLFTMPPEIAFAAPGAAEALEVRLANTGSGPVMTAGFSVDLTPADPALSFKDMTASTLEMYIFIGNPMSGLDVASEFTPEGAARGLAFPASSTLAPGATVGLGRITYSMAHGASLSDVFDIGFGSPGIGASLPDGAGGDFPITAGNLVDRAVTDAPEAKALLPAGLLLIGLGAFGRRQIRPGRRRRTVPGVRKSPICEGRASNQARTGPRYVAL